MLAMQPRHQLKNHLRRRPVQIAGWLIGQQQLRLCDQRPCQRESLLLAAGKLAGTMRGPRLQSHFAQPAQSFLFCGKQLPPTCEQGHGHILDRSEFGQQVMELPHVADLAVTKLGSVILRQCSHPGIRAVYGTCRRTIKRSQDVQ